MPRKSRKILAEETLASVCHMRIVGAMLRQIYGNQSFLEDIIDQMYFYLYRWVQQRRYLLRHSYRTGLSSYVFRLDLQSTHKLGYPRPFLSDHEFLQKYRVSRASFTRLLSMIETHPVFQAPRRGPRQLPPSHQLMVFLKYIGTEGSGGSNPDLRNMFRTGRGSNELYKLRVVQAIRSLRQLFYSWPDDEERRLISSRIQQKYHLPNCVGFADGTLNPLAAKPRRQDAADYFGRKHGYALSTMIVCDDKRLIRYYLAGWPGSCHDNRIFRNSRIATLPERFFGSKEYVVGDSAFEASPFMIPAFKKPQGLPIPQEYENFNSCLSAARVISEHTIGIWKARFPWLRNIRMLITEERKSIKAILNTIECTVILHNFLVMGNESEVPPEWLSEADISHLDANDELNCGIPQGSPKNLRQMQLMTYINELLY